MCLSDLNGAKGLNRSWLIGSLLLTAALPPKAQDLPGVLGGGNFYADSLANKGAFEALNTLGAGMCRISVEYYWDGEFATPEVYDGVVMQAYRNGINPTMLFEYYVSKNGPLGGPGKWSAIGKAFAERFAPGGFFGKQYGLNPSWGVTQWAAINEPEVENKIPKDQYKAALEALADAIHAVSPTLKVMPGGFMAANSWDDWTLRGYGTAIAPLYNSGKLSSMDLHTYYDVQYAPMEGGFTNSAQYNFDQVKKTLGITRDIDFLTTEFNYKKRVVNEDQAAKGILTGIWDNFGVVATDGKRSVSRFAMVWNIFNNSVEDPEYGLSLTLSPWAPTTRGKVLQMFIGLVKGMTFIEMDPRGKGEFVLVGEGRKLWVWQNRTGWTNHKGTGFTITKIPAGATKLDVYTYKGLLKTIDLAGKTEISITGLAEEETTMFLATGFTGMPDGDRQTSIRSRSVTGHLKPNFLTSGFSSFGSKNDNRLMIDTRGRAIFVPGSYR